MARFLHPVNSFTFRKSGHAVLALSWLSGLGFGGLVFRYAGSDLVSQMPLAAVSQPSIFGLLISSFLPFLFSAFAVYISAQKLLYGICFAKAFLFSYISFGLLTSFGTGGWLVRLLFLFTDICSVVLLYHYWMRHISGFRAFSAKVFAGYFIPVFLIVLADYGYISPLLLRCLF